MREGKEEGLPLRRRVRFSELHVCSLYFLHKEHVAALYHLLFPCDTSICDKIYVLARRLFFAYKLHKGNLKKKHQIFTLQKIGKWR